MSDIEGPSGSESREKTKQWLTEVLQTYYTYLAKKAGSSGNGSRDAVSLVPVSVLDFDIGPGFFAGDGRVSTLSDLLSLQVHYKIAEEEKTENLIVKIPPNDKADREMAQMAQVDRREIHFYTEALPQMEEWAKSRNTEITLNVPRCYFAKYHTQPSGGGQDEGANLVSDAESVLVLEDMRPVGFTMRDFNTGLSLEEAFSALGEIAIIHSLSWAMQEVTEVPLDERWELTYRPHKAASAYKTMIEHGFPTLSDFLERQQPDGEEILSKLQALHPKAIELLYELLKPPPPPAPSCLTHMDFWCNNLLFRRAGSRSRPSDNANNEVISNGADIIINGAHGSNSRTSSSSNDSGTECLILDWQMMAVSRPTHDVALLLFTSLTPEVRQQNSERLLRHYWNVFQETATKLRVEIPFDYGVIENEFKKSQLLALLLVIGSIDMALDSPRTEQRLIHALRDMAREDLI